MDWIAGRVMLLSGWRRAALAMAAGLLAVLALPPFSLFAAPFLSFPILVWLIDGVPADPARGLLRRYLPAMWTGWCFGFGYLLGGLWWLGNALLVEADTFAWALPLAIFGLPAVLAFYYGLAVVLARLLWSEGWGRIAALAGAFGVAEWARASLLTGFPWNAIGYAAMPLPMAMQSVSLVGLMGMNVAAVFVFSAPALLGTRRGALPGLCVAIALLCLHLGFGAWRLAQPAAAPLDPPMTLRVVQPVIDQAKKLDDAARAEVFETHLALTAALPAPGQRRPDLIVWPETAVPFILTENPDALARIAEVLQDGQVLVTGAVRAEDAGSGLPPRYYNSMIMIDHQGQIIGGADKVHLVPFGEYLPLEGLISALGLHAIAAEMPGGFSPAAARMTMTLPGGRVLYPLICYEAIFPAEIGDSALSASALLNLTNDAWFGDTPGPYQHFLQARLRAVETGVPMLRAANSGISALIDPFGRVEKGLNLGVAGFFDAELPPRAAPLVPPSGQARNGLIFLVISLAVAAFSRLSFVFREN
ncbi:apolipoprotein N-acyltransferase [Xaviernesmea oryzae]|uniref:Apolipoprotein N-acyltransferase n=1 Tax=Xaviernesmea oryzae TaxID=464029 RepID=A0A1Q9AUX3_9HYPH|nr:apolipoprotein N-acyltransferase [Xaviernesmea oryzae]OLP59250.1 apolipoprotein N-acyltransferase [Xaviernesmea oryzae]SEK79573.1 apolipoprotein N-acyltransferase [Xaviernesmea oryzae]